ncbi:TIGR00725 family protein [Alicyclobacillus dauci]|uniref:TIGR00725 family protein n=1 Tax=Alicyclobacillus dauci TaxID=1475485 RepID=A0ABY6Z3R6_9BACL|nr:TIGR00725 family protein [Alicyclobacillus dauci]WAH36929.1 TIGR00725 family protein [Alicyclobacillus dauci]
MLRIGVIGQSGKVDEETLRLAEEMGKEIASRKAIILTGGTNGVMEAASRGAKLAGGLVVGLLPGDESQVANEYVDIPITTGFGFDFRSMVLVHSSDAVVMIGGGVGTLVELSAAYMLHKPVIVLEPSSGWAKRVKDIAYEGLYLDHRRENYPHQLDFASTPKDAFDLILTRAKEVPSAHSTASDTSGDIYPNK